MKKQIALLYAFILVSVAVLVAVTIPVFGSVAATDVAKIGDTGYGTLPQAFAAAKDGDTIVLLKDIDVTTAGSGGRIQCTANNMRITLDGNGKTITSVADAALAILGMNLNVTIRDLTIQSNDTTSYGCTLQVNSGTTITLDGCKLYSNKNNMVGSVIIQANGKLILDGDTLIQVAGGSAIRFNGASAQADVYRATVQADTAVNTNAASAVLNVFDGAMILQKNTLIQGTSGMTARFFGGTVKTESATNAAIVAANQNFSITVFGGAFEGGSAVLQNANGDFEIAYPDGTSKLTLRSPSIALCKGASIRLQENSCGIRFTSVIEKSAIERLEQLKSNGSVSDYGFGTLIAKKEALSGIDFTAEALSAAGKGTGDFADIPAKNGIEVDTDTGNVTVNAALVNIQVKHYNTELAAVSYIEYRFEDGTTVRVYADYIADDHVRTVKQIAYEALSDVSETEQTEYPNLVTSYYVKEKNGYTQIKGSAYSCYSAKQRVMLQNYLDGIINFDPKTIQPSLTETTVSVADKVNAIFLPIGRTYVRNGGLACDFTCTGIKFNATCEGTISVALRTDSDTYFTVYVDGERTENRIKATSGSTWVDIATGLQRGEHEIMLVKQTQFSMATTELSNVRICGTFSEELPKQKDLFIEFYGDSILNGSNIFLGGTSAYTSDGTQAFGWLTAQALGADCNIIGCGGLGLSVSGDNFVMDDVWNLNGSLRADGVTKYDFKRTPDVVVVELGVNDEARKGNTTEAKYKAAVLQFVKNLREAYGKDVPIVWVYGYHDQAYWTLTKEALDSVYAGENDNIYYCKLSKSYIPTAQGGDGWHPNVKTSQTMAEELTAFLKTILY